MTDTSIYFRGVNASESASLHGRKALTPIIAGAVSGGFVAIAWVIGFIVHFVKRRQHEAAAIAAGYKSYRDFIVAKPTPNSMAFRIPPDPAVTGDQKGATEPEIVVEDEDEGTERGAGLPRSDRTEPGSPSSQQLLYSAESTPPSGYVLSSPWTGASSSVDSAASFLSTRDSDSPFPPLSRLRSLDNIRE